MQNTMEKYKLNLTYDELIILNNTLNEILYYDNIEEPLFSIKIGDSRDNAIKLLNKISSFINEMSTNETTKTT